MVALNMYEVRRCVAWIWRRGLGLSKDLRKTGGM